MAPLMFLFFLFFSLFLQKPTTAQPTCPQSCPGGGAEIKFPFGLNRGGNPNGRCSYPGFGLSCSNKTGEPILNLPKSGEFIVRHIDYEAQQIWISDPENCLPKRFFQSFNTSGSPFDSEFWYNFAVFNCSTSELADAGIRSIPCLSDQNYSIAVAPEAYYMDSTRNSLPTSCLFTKFVAVPYVWYGLWDGARLSWSGPDCRSCVERGGDCRFRNRTSLEIGCFNLPSRGGGIPRSAKYGIILGVGVPGFLCLIGLFLFIGSRVRTYAGRRNLPSMEFSTSISPSPAVMITGLDGPTIESYPKTKLGDSGRLPKPNDNTCPICLSEYQPKETLRTIPECNHYFHANCIDAWLKMNASCPLCRNSPSGSAAITPSISSSSSSSSSSSP